MSTTRSPSMSGSSVCKRHVGKGVEERLIDLAIASRPRASPPANGLSTTPSSAWKLASAAASRRLQASWTARDQFVDLVIGSWLRHDSLESLGDRCALRQTEESGRVLLRHPVDVLRR